MTVRGRDWVLEDPIRAYLFTKGLVYLGIGLTWFLMPSRGRDLGISWFPGLTDWMVGLLWFTGGTVAITTGLRGQGRRYGFAGLQAVSFFMAMVFLVSAILGLIPDDIFLGGNTRSIVTTISYLGFWSSAVVVAQMKPQPVVDLSALEEEVLRTDDS